MSLKISAIIPTKDRHEACLECVQSMLRQTIPFSEVIVVEAISDRNILAEELKLLSHPCSKIIHIETSKPGLTRQRNLGISQATADIIFFTDDDTVLEKDFVEQILKAYGELGENVGGVQPLLSQESSVPIFSLLLRKVFLLSDINNDRSPYMKSSGFPCLAHRPDQPLPAEVFCGVASYRRSIFDDYKFDELLVGYGAMEDIDFSYRVSSKFPLWIYPAARVYHYPDTHGRDSREKYYEMTIQNYWYLFHKNLPNTLINNLAFIWANLGVLLFVTINSIRWRTAAPLVGTIKGIKTSVKTLRSKKR